MAEIKWTIRKWSSGLASSEPSQPNWFNRQPQWTKRLNLEVKKQQQDDVRFEFICLFDMLNLLSVRRAPDDVSPLVFPVASHWLSLSPCLCPVPSLSPCLGHGSVPGLGPGTAHGFFGGCCGEKKTWSSSAATDVLVHCREPEEIHQHNDLFLLLAEEVQASDYLSFPTFKSMCHVFWASHHPHVALRPWLWCGSAQNMERWSWWRLTEIKMQNVFKVLLVWIFNWLLCFHLALMINDLRNHLKEVKLKILILPFLSEIQINQSACSLKQNKKPQIPLKVSQNAFKHVFF